MCQRWTDRDIDNQLFAEYAKSNPDEQIIFDLINFGADINAVDNKGESLLINAICNVSFGLDLRFVSLLIDAGVDIKNTVQGQKCLYIAVMNVQPEIISLLLNAGADPNSIYDDQSVSLLDWAEAKMFHDEYCHSHDCIPMEKIVQLLKSYGARSITELNHVMIDELSFDIIPEFTVKSCQIYKEV